MLRELARRVLDRQACIAKELRSFLLLCHVVDAYSLIQGGHRPARWAEAIAVWLDAFKEAYPTSMPKPKHHMAIDSVSI